MAMNTAPDVKKCTVLDCFYNTSQICHASAIQVGSDHPMCDTFIVNHRHDQPADQAMVGACHQADCEYNMILSCNAPSIDVGWHEQHADCLTYEPR